MPDEQIDTAGAAMSHDPHAAELRRLRERIDLLEQRLARLEQSAGAARVLPPSFDPSPLDDLPSEPPEPPQPPPLPDWLKEGSPFPPVREASLAPPPLPPIARVADRRLDPGERPPPASEESRSLESMIGQNWASWVGGIVLFLGIVFFLKYAWDQGWIRPSPEVRVAAAVAFGVVLAALGEWSFRRQLRGLAESLYGAGAAVVLASIFAANIYFDPPVLDRPVTFACVAVAAAAAIVAALHINSMALAILALIGAYLAPRLLASGRDESAFLLAYLGALAAVGWGLAYFRPRWIPLRWLGLICIWLWAYLWWASVGERNDHHTLGLIFTCALYVGFTLEAVLTLRRHREEPSPAADLQDAARPATRPVLHVSLAMISLLVTAATFGMLAAIYAPTSQPLVGAFAVGLAGAQIFAALYAPSRAWRLSSILQAAALVTLAVPLVFDEFAVTLAWVLLAIVLAILAWRLELKSVRAWAVVLLVLATGRLVSLDQFDPALRTVVTHVLGEPVSRWLLTAWSIAVLFHVFAWLRPAPQGTGPSGLQRWIDGTDAPDSRPDEADANSPRTLSYSPLRVPAKAAVLPALLDPGGVALAAVGTCLFAAVTATTWHGPVLTLAAIAWLAPIALLARVGRHVGYGWHAAILALLVTFRWFAADNLLPLLGTWTSGHTTVPILHLPALCGALLVGAVLLVCWDARLLGFDDREDEHSPGFTDDVRTAAIVWAALIAFALVNFELWRTIDWLDATGAADLADRAIVKHVSMSVLWAIVGFAAVVLGFRQHLAPLRWAALGLLGITLLKILVIDMSEVRAIWRILSFIAVGALLLAVSFVYHRQMSSAEEQPDRS